MRSREARCVTAPSSRPRLHAALWLAALALASVDLLLRISAASTVDPTPGFGRSTTDAQVLGEGAPFTLFPTLSAAFYVYVLHGLTVPLVLLVAWEVQRWGAALPSAALGRRVAVSMASAVVLLVGTSQLVIEARPRDWRFSGHPTRIWGMRPDMVLDDADGALTDGEGHRCTPQARPERSGWLMLGDSTTYGVLVRRSDETYVWRLAMLLEAAGHPINAYNYAVPGYTTWQGLTVLREELTRVRPQLVTVAFMANDWTWSAQPDRMLSAAPAVRPLLTLLRECNAFLFLEDRMLGSQSRAAAGSEIPARTSQVRVPVGDFRANLLAMVDACRVAQTRLVFICLPMGPALEGCSAPYRACVADVGRATGTPVIDLYTEWVRSGRNRIDFNDTDPVHPLPQGHARIAAILARLLPSCLEGGAEGSTSLHGVRSSQAPGEPR